MTTRQLALRHTLSCMLSFGASLFVVVMLAFNTTAHSRDANYLFVESVGGRSPLVAVVSLIAGWIACALGWRKVITLCTAAPWVYLFVGFALFLLLA